MLILIVEDEPDIIELVNFRLRKAGHEIISASTGAEAIEMSQYKLPDLVLLDLSLPDIRGEEVCRKLKSDEKTKHIPVIFLTASNPKNAAEAQQEWEVMGRW